MVGLGVTGGIGSGKSTVCRVFERLGARVCTADAEARRIIESDPDVRAAMEGVLGPVAYRPDGALNRGYVASRLFGDAALAGRVNAIVHPHVMAACRAARARAEADGAPLFVFEAALLFEVQAEASGCFDTVLVVDAPLDVRVRRAAARDAVTPDVVLARVAYQLAPGEMRRRADHIIDNDGSLARLEAQAEALFGKLLVAGR